MMNDLDSGLNLKGDLCDAGMSGELACQTSMEHSLNINMKFIEQDDLNFSFEYPDNIMDTMLPGAKSNETSKAVLSKYSLFNENFQYLSAFRFGPQKSYNRDTSLVVTKNKYLKSWDNVNMQYIFLSSIKNTNIPIKEL